MWQIILLSLDFFQKRELELENFCRFFSKSENNGKILVIIHRFGKNLDILFSLARK